MNLVIGKTSANKDTNVCASDTFFGHTRAFESFESAFEEKTLLGVECGSLLDGHVEERGIEPSRIFCEEVAALCVDASLFARRWMVVGVFGVACRGCRPPASTASGAQLP